MLNALADAVQREVRSEHHLHSRIEGDPQTGWVLVDYGSVVAHIFNAETRHYYDLEGVWKEASVLLHMQ